MHGPSVSEKTVEMRLTYTKVYFSDTKMSKCCIMLLPTRFDDYNIYWERQGSLLDRTKKKYSDLIYTPPGRYVHIKNVTAIYLQYILHHIYVGTYTLSAYYIL